VPKCIVLFLLFRPQCRQRVHRFYLIFFCIQLLITSFILNHSSPIFFSSGENYFLVKYDHSETYDHDESDTDKMQKA
jgi:hypothetical protein